MKICWSLLILKNSTISMLLLQRQNFTQKHLWIWPQNFSENSSSTDMVLLSAFTGRGWRTRPSSEGRAMDIRPRTVGRNFDHVSGVGILREGREGQAEIADCRANIRNRWQLLWSRRRQSDNIPSMSELFFW